MDRRELLGALGAIGAVPVCGSLAPAEAAAWARRSPDAANPATENRPAGGGQTIALGGPYDLRMLTEIARALEVPVNEHEQTFVQAQPMNALVEPADVAAAVVYLLSDESSQVTGSVLTVDGGFTAR